MGKNSRANKKATTLKPKNGQVMVPPTDEIKEQDIDTTSNIDEVEKNEVEKDASDAQPENNGNKEIEKEKVNASEVETGSSDAKKEEEKEEDNNGHIEVVGKVFMILPNGGELKLGEKTILSKEDHAHLKKCFGEEIKHLLE